MSPRAERSARSEGQHTLVLEDGTECTIELLSEDVGFITFRGVGPSPLHSHACGAVAQVQMGGHLGRARDPPPWR